MRPAIDGERCVRCGACDTTCPVLNPPADDDCEYALWAKVHDSDLLDRSSSGGVFGLMAKDVLSRGGVVVGAAWAEGCRELCHVIVEDEAGLDAIMRSKYVQSSVGREVYEGVHVALRAGRPALFAGTACQVAAMRSYLGGLAGSGLFLGVDVICHGVPSPRLWKEWLAYVEDCEDGSVFDVNFRSKITGWLSYSVLYKYKTEKDNASRFSANKFADDWYMRAFLRNASLRPSCLSCPFKRRCGSDLTLGDFWGIRRQHPDVSVVGGVSAVVVSTAKGGEAIRGIADVMDVGESSLEKVIAGNPALVRPVRPHPDYQEFMHVVADGVPIADMVARWDFEPTLRQKAISVLKRGIARFFERTRG